MTRHDRDFDLIVIGGGSGGLGGAFRAASHGAKVALLEPDALGGTCVNAGCVPKKAMWLAADAGEQLAAARALGFAVPDDTPLDWNVLLRHRAAYIDNIHASYRRKLEAGGVTVIAQRGALTAQPGEVRTDDGLLRAGRILLATGGHPIRPDIPGAELGGVSDDFFAMTSPPKRVAIIGAGYIGVELASVLHALGSHVELFARHGHLLQAFDDEVTGKLAEAFAEDGITLHFDCKVAALEGTPGDIRVMTLGDVAHGPFDHVLFATGRGPNTAGLGLQEAGIACNARGQVVIDEWQATSRSDVFAVGDVTPQPALTPMAIAAARRLMDRLYGGQADARVDVSQLPTVVFTHPPLATVGLSEADAREAHGDAVKVYRADFRPMLQSLSDGHRRFLYKLVCVGPEEKVVGLHMVGPGSDEILQGFAVAMRMGMTRRDLHDTLAIHPTSAEELVLI
ncbi:glutathione-disulfide reductase [Lysobacter oculi]|uniref:Glutathione-disulfide reductase n=1 Tax=Solilutibacter oculi TaxID=2698682 RepID=A0A344J5J5_9GAMM|nr:glutathione-disulfide reductase [Lysobacter oculi]AXA84305.1 glutathione-disulfide reductase [Lysobacter oculi]